MKPYEKPLSPQEYLMHYGVYALAAVERPKKM